MVLSVDSLVAKGYNIDKQINLNMQEMKIIILIACLLKITSSGIVVETKTGPIRSTVALSDDVEAFLGVPYAEPPVGDLRFAKPVPKQQWNEVYNASKLPPACMQVPREFKYYMTPDLTGMSEDCLYLNIWAPKAGPERGLRPVIIYFHHGAFYFGSSNQKEFDGSKIASLGDTVVVTVNNRLGTLGFFLAYTDEANGSMAMYDQLLAIKWVKDNAIYFSGDPENIVLMGTSAGSASILGHMISPLSQNLFKRAIMMSGSLLNPMFMDENARLFKNSERIASIVNCTNDTLTLKNDPSSVVKCLKERSKEDLMEAESRLLKGNPVIFYPRTYDQFLPREIASLVKEGKFRKDVDVMIGCMEEEGNLLMVFGIPEYFGQYGHVDLNNMRKSRASVMARSAAFMGGVKNPSEMIKYYLTTIKNETPEEYTKMVANIVGDYGTSCGNVFFADFLSLKGNKVYYYKMGFRAASTPTAEWMGASHLDDVQYIFGNPYHENFTAEEEELSNRLIARLSAFSRTGNPNLPGQMPWLRYSYHNPLYLHIGQEEESIRMKPLERCEYWRSEFKSDIDSDLIRFLRNSGMNVTGEEDSET